MKNKLLLLLVAIIATSNMKADPTGFIIHLMEDFKTLPENGGPNRSPVLVPEFYLDGYTLTAGSYTVGSTVELKNEDGEVVFTSYIYVEGDTVTLPSSLSGTYTIEVTRGSQTFVGEIEL